ERAGEVVLVGDGLRPRDARVHPRDAEVGVLVPHAGTDEERRRLGGRLLRPDSAGGEGIKLGADESRRQVRGAVPVLWPGEASIRENMEAAGYREDPMSDPLTIRSALNLEPGRSEFED